MKKSIILFFVMLVLSIALAGCTKSANSNQLTKQMTPDKIIETASTEKVKEFTIEAFRYGFNPKTITVNQGDTVRISASSIDVPHGFAIPEYKINLYLNGLQEKTAEFVATKKGNFQIICSVPCGSGHGTMNGVLIVT